MWGGGGVVEDISPVGDKLVVFWSDQVIFNPRSKTCPIMPNAIIELFKNALN